MTQHPPDKCAALNSVPGIKNENSKKKKKKMCWGPDQSLQMCYPQSSHGSLVNAGVLDHSEDSSTMLRWRETQGRRKMKQDSLWRSHDHMLRCLQTLSQGVFEGELPGLTPPSDTSNPSPISFQQLSHQRAVNPQPLPSQGDRSRSATASSLDFHQFKFWKEARELGSSSALAGLAVGS